jgi:type VI secretion system secreted protein VgrG
MNNNEKSPWLRIASPHGGGDKGMYFIPEIGEEAIVGFEGGNPQKAFIIGTAYHGKAKTSFANAGNDVKALQTRSGNKLVLNDDKGSVNLTDKGGADMLFDGAGLAKLQTTDVITLNGKNKIELVCGASSITLFEDGRIIINGLNIFVDGSETANVTSGENSGIAITPSDLGAVSATTVITGKSELNAGGATINVGGGGAVNVSAGKVSIN